MLRLARSMISAWSRDSQFRSLVVLVIVTLLGGTIFYSTVEGGDLAPTTTIGKLFTVIYIFAGIGIILGFIDTVAKETLSHQTKGRGSGEGKQDVPGGSD